MPRSKSVRRMYALFPDARDCGMTTRRTPAYSHPMAVVDLSPASLDRLLEPLAMSVARISTGVFNDPTRTPGVGEGDREKARIILAAILGPLPRK